MSSDREAPEISKDPVADNTDTYAFVSPDDPSTVTIIANYLPLEGPFGGPNFFEFGDDVLYSIFIDNNGDSWPCSGKVKKGGGGIKSQITLSIDCSAPSGAKTGGGRRLMTSSTKYRIVD